MFWAGPGMPRPSWRPRKGGRKSGAEINVRRRTASLTMRLVPGLLRGPFRGLPREVPVLTAVSFTVALGYGIVAPAIPAFARQFGVSTAAAASVISAFALMRVLGALPAGRLVDGSVSTK